MKAIQAEKVSKNFRVKQKEKGMKGSIKAVKKMASIDKMTKDGTFDNLSKREKLQISRQRAKLEKTLG